jgi:EpsI family protein
MPRAGPPAGLLIALLIAGAIARHEVASAPEPPAPSPLPDTFAADGLRFVPVPLGDVERLLEADRVIHTEARAPSGEEVGTLFLAYHRNRRSVAEPHAPQVCYRANGWALSPVRADDLDGGAAFVAEKGTEKRLVYFWYATRAGSFDEPLGLKLDLVRASLARRPTDALLVRVAIAVRAGEAEHDALARARRFAAEIRPPLRDLMRPSD